MLLAIVLRSIASVIDGALNSKIAPPDAEFDVPVAVTRLSVTALRVMVR